MTSTSLVVAVAVVLPVLVFVLVRAAARRRPADVTPAPAVLAGGHPIFGFATVHGRDRTQQKLMAARTGAPIVNVPNGFSGLLLVNDVEYVKRTFQASSQRLDEGFFSINHSQDVLSIEPEEQWRPMRRRLNQFFTAANVNGMFPKVYASASDTAKRLRATVKAHGDPMLYHDLTPIVQRSVMDSLVRCVFSRPFDEALDTQRIHLIDRLNATMVANFIDHLPVLRYVNPLYREHFRVGQALSELSRKELDDRASLIAELGAESKDVPHDLVSNLLGVGVRPTADDMVFTKKMEVDNINIFFFAGLDTTSQSLLFALALLGLHPDVMAKAVKEVDQVFAELGLDQDDNDAGADDQGDELRITHDDFVSKLVYLDKIVKEATRLYPSASGTSRVIHEDTQIGEHFVRKGTRLFLNFAGIARMPKHFEKADEFYPEHFDEEAVKARDHHAYFPFGGGARACIGFKLAQQEQRVILAHLLHNFTFEIHPQQKIEVVTGLTNNFKGPLRMRILPRVLPGRD